jgi:trk system potassium uptake protein TrkH
MRPVLANLGFIFQIAGILTLVSVIVGFYFSETNAIISLFITASVYFCVGFSLNALSERKELDFKSSCILLSAVFFLLSLVNSIPYIYLNVFSGDLLARFTNSYFEAVAGQTTTGATLIEDVEALPRAIILYRGMSQWVGGMSILFIFLAFLYPEKSIAVLSKTIHLTEGSEKIKSSFASILTIQMFYVVLFVFLFYFIGGLTNLIETVPMVISGVAAGGVKPVNDFSALMHYPNNILMCLLMAIAATSFPIHQKIFSGKFKEAFNKEFFVFLIIIFSASFLLFEFLKWDVVTSFFHVISVSASSGFATIDFIQLGEAAKLLFIVLMFIGGMSISPANGIRVARLIMFFKSIPWVVRNAIEEREEPFVFNGKEMKPSDFYINMAFILLAGFLVVLCAVVFSLHGFPLTDSLFQSVTLFTNTGISFNVLTLSSPLYLKWMGIFLMIFGRVEIFPVLIAFSQTRKIS